MGRYVSHRDGGKTDELGLFRWLKQMFRPGYVTGANVTQRGAGANMSVDVQVGDTIDHASDRAFYGWHDAVENVAISASDPTNPRKDIVVEYTDLAVVSSASPNNPNAKKYLAVAGTPAGSPVDPSDSAIQTAVGAGNPWNKLARADVAANATSIVNANITDLRKPAAFAIPYLWGGGSNTSGHLVPNVPDDTVALLNAVQTFLNKTLTRPKLSTSLDDTNGNELIKPSATASAVNEVTIGNAATGGAPSISATGDDTNIPLNHATKGTGDFLWNGKLGKCRVYRDTDVGIANNAWTGVPFVTEDFDPDVMHDNASNTTRITIPTGGAGYYIATGQIRFAANGTGSRGIRFLKNGATSSALGGGQFDPSANASIDHGINISSGIVKLSAGDYLEMQAFQNSGGSLNAKASTAEYELGTWFSLTRVP